MTQWRLLGAHARSVMRAPLALAEKWRLGRFLARIAISRRDALARELLEAVRHAIHRVRLTFAG
jgi:hypothetical protein